jgi:hypothetical protein
MIFLSMNRQHQFDIIDNQFGLGSSFLNFVNGSGNLRGSGGSINFGYA